MGFYYDPTDRACKSERGAVPRGAQITFRVYLKNDGEESDLSAGFCHFVLYADGRKEAVFPMQRKKDRFELTLGLDEVGLFFYYFTLSSSRFLGRGALRKAVVCDHPESWQITVYDESYTTPEWFKGGIMYQIFPDRFNKSGEFPVPPHKILRSDWGGCPSFRPDEHGKVLNNDFFGGNLNGITEKLDHLAALHVTAVYLNPIFEAYSNHRYDTGDFMKIDPLLGTTMDFDRLVSEGKKRGIRIILDGVFNHTGDDSRYFNKYGRYDSVGAFQSLRSPYADWYDFWQFPTSYKSWWGIETLPAVNEETPSYREFICGENGVVKTWLSHGIGGYRLDVADELPGGFLRAVRTAVKKADPEAVVIGEVWEDASNKISYGERRSYLQGFELDSVMNYPLKNGIIHFIRTGNTSELREAVAMLLDNYPKQTLDCLMNILGTHDTPRILTVLGGKECADKEEMARTRMTADERARAKQKLKMAAVLQFTLPGVPCIYYGDEAGMEGDLDPFCRGCFPWDSPDEELEAFYATLGDIRLNRAGGLFKDGEYRELFADAGCLVYERRKDEKAVYVYCNNSACRYQATLAGDLTEELEGKPLARRFEIEPYSCGILTKRQK